jgi:DegV family protein with EDD domain
MALEEFPEKEVHVIDSRQLSLAEGFQVLATAEAIEDGATIESILELIKDLQSRLHVYGALPTLKYLAMGGRMGRLAAGFGETLEIKPILNSSGGKLELLEKVRTWRKAKARLVELAVQSTAGRPIERVGMLHVNNEEGALALFDSLKTALGFELEPLITEFTPGLSVHTGSGVIGYVIVTK